MVAIPFIYFTILSLLIYRRNRDIDLALITSLVYATSGFFAILNDMFDLRYKDLINYEISIEATIAYCGLLTLCLLPLIFNSHLKISNIRPMSNVRLLRFLAWFAFFWFVITIWFSRQSIINVLTGDMQQLRTDAYDGFGQELWFKGLPGPLRFLCGVISSFFGCPWTLIFLAFFSQFIQKLPKRYFLLFLIASLMGPIEGIIGADRSKTAYWIMSFGAMYILFLPKINSIERKKIVSFGVLIIGTLSLYLAAMTISRFGERDYGDVGGSEGGLISYMGQSFVTFCFYFDNYQSPFINLGIIFPFTSYQIFGIPSGGVVIQHQMTNITGLWTGVFYTFIGHIIVGAGKTVAIIYCLVYTIASSITSKTICNRKEASASSLYLYFAFTSVIYLGLFGHYYSDGTITFGLVTMFIMIKILEKTY